MKNIMKKIVVVALMFPLTLLASEQKNNSSSNFTIVPVAVELTNINQNDPTSMVVNFGFNGSGLQHIDQWQNNNSSVSAGANKSSTVTAFTLYNFEGKTISGSLNISQMSVTDGESTFNLASMLPQNLFQFSNNQLAPISSRQSCYTDTQTTLVCCVNTDNTSSVAEILLQCGNVTPIAK